MFLFDAMRANRIKPTVITYSSLINVYGKGGQWEKALQVPPLPRPYRPFPRALKRACSFNLPCGISLDVTKTHAARIFINCQFGRGYVLGGKSVSEKVPNFLVQNLGKLLVRFCGAVWLSLVRLPRPGLGLKCGERFPG